MKKLLAALAALVQLSALGDSKISQYQEKSGVRTNDFLVVAQPDLNTNSKVAVLNFSAVTLGNTNNLVPAWINSLGNAGLNGILMNGDIDLNGFGLVNADSVNAGATLINGLGNIIMAPSAVIYGSGAGLSNVPLSSLNVTVLTNNWANSAGYVYFSNAVVLAQSNSNAGLVVSNGANFVVITNGFVTLSGGSVINGTTTVGSSFVNAASIYGGNFRFTDGTVNMTPSATVPTLNRGVIVTSNAIVGGTLIATNGVIQMVKPSFTTNFTCTTNLQTYLVNGTNQLLTLPNAANVPNVIYTFSVTNGYASWILTNATGAQTIGDGKSFSLTNGAEGHQHSLSLISDGAHWWNVNRSEIIWPSASYSSSTNCTFASVTNSISMDTTEATSGAGIALDNSQWWVNGIGSRIWVTNSGHYFLSFSAMWSKTGGGSANGDVWIRQDGAILPRTMTLQTIQNSTSTNVMTVTFVLPVTKLTYFDLVGASPDGTAQIQAMPAITTPFERPAAPGIIVTINKISD